MTAIMPYFQLGVHDIIMSYTTDNRGFPLNGKRAALVALPTGTTATTGTTARQAPLYDHERL